MKREGSEWTLWAVPFYMEEQGSAPSTPRANAVKLYGKDNGSGVSTLAYKNDAGTEILFPTAGSVVGGSGTANRLAYWNSSSTITANAALTQNRLVTADSNGLPASVSALTATHVLFADSNGLPTGEADLKWDGDKLLIGGANNTELLRISATNQILSLKEVTGDSALYMTLGTNGQTNACLVVPESILILIDSANDSTTRSLIIKKDTATAAGGTTIFTVTEAGVANILTGIQINSLGASGTFLRGDGTNYIASTLTIPNTATSTRLVYATASNAYGESADLTYDGTDLAIASGKRFRMQSQNRIRYLNSVVVATRTTTQSINNTTFTAVAFNATDLVDTDGLHDPASNNSRLTAAIAGKYVFFCNISYEFHATGSRNLSVDKNSNGTHTSAAVIAASAPQASSTILTQLNVSGIVSLAANDHIEAWTYQDSGGSLNVDGATVAAFFSMAYIGE